MATVTPNGMINGFRGKFGNLVFKTIRGKTFLSPAARKPSKKKETEAQRATRVTFKEAARWAKSTVRDPQKKEYYRKRAKALKLPNAYTAALTDYMRKPTVVEMPTRDTITWSVSKRGFNLQHVRVVSAETTEPVSNIVVKQHGDLWAIHYKPDVDRLFSFAIVITDSGGRTTAINV